MSVTRDLEQIADLRYRRHLASLAPLLQEEARLRGELARLGEMERDARDTDATGLMRPLGADLLWNAWIDKRRRELTMRLARVLSRKEVDMAAMRQAHGRLQAIRMIAGHDDKIARKKRNELAIASLQAQVVRRT